MESIVEKFKMETNFMNNNVTVRDFCDFMNRCANVRFKRKKDKKIIEKISGVINGLNCNIEACGNECWLPDSIEDLFFLNLLGTVDCNHILYRYISLSSLSRLINANTQSMLSVVSMNDKSEIDYADKYKDKFMGSVDVHNKQFIYDCYNTYILSCLELEDEDLTMWRLYAEDTKGACIIYKVEKMNDNFKLAKVSYADKDGKHRELNLILTMMKNNLDFS